MRDYLGLDIVTTKYRVRTLIEGFDIESDSWKILDSWIEDEFNANDFKDAKNYVTKIR